MFDLVTAWSDRAQGSLKCWKIEKEECELFSLGRKLIRTLKMFSLLQRMLSTNLESCGLHRLSRVVFHSVYIVSGK